MRQFRSSLLPRNYVLGLGLHGQSQYEKTESLFYQYLLIDVILPATLIIFVYMSP